MKRTDSTKGFKINFPIVSKTASNTASNTKRDDSDRSPIYSTNNNHIRQATMTNFPNPNTGGSSTKGAS